MKFKIEIECDNASFAEDLAGEIRWILDQRVIPELRKHQPGPAPLWLRDSNGNRVGTATLVEEG